MVAWSVMCRMVPVRRHDQEAMRAGERVAADEAFRTERSRDRGPVSAARRRPAARRPRGGRSRVPGDERAFVPARQPGRDATLGRGLEDGEAERRRGGSPRRRRRSRRVPPTPRHRRRPTRSVPRRRRPAPRRPARVSTVAQPTATRRPAPTGSRAGATDAAANARIRAAAIVAHQTSTQVRAPAAPSWRKPARS